MDHVSPRIMKRFLETAHMVGDAGLARCSSGNLSLRIDRDLMLVSASRSWLSRLTEGDLAVCTISGGRLVSGNRPSVETGMHRGILSVRPEKNVVLHFQSPAATALCCREGPVDFNVLPEIPFYIGEVGWVPYRLPGSPELAEATTGVMSRCDLALLQNHGLVTTAEDLDHAVQNAQFFELACEIIVRNGEAVSRLSSDTVAELRALGKGEPTAG